MKIENMTVSELEYLIDQCNAEQSINQKKLDDIKRQIIAIDKLIEHLEKAILNAEEGDDERK